MVTTVDADRPPLVWFEEALNPSGIREVPGERSNAAILSWAKGLNIDYRDDGIPWCGLFVAHCIGSTLPDEILPPSPVVARSWQNFGDSCSPVRGAILVFWRGKRRGSLGHVGFYHSEDNRSYHVLGCNQSNSVSLTRIGKSRLLAARWPRTAAILTGSVVEAEGYGALSHNEA